MSLPEADLLNLIDTPVFVLEADAHGRPVFVAFNDAACQVANVQRSQTLGRTAKDVYDGEVGSIVYQRHVSVLHSGEKTTFALTFPIEGRMRHIKVVLNPLKSADGQVIRIVGTVTDVTAEHDLRHERSRTQAVTSELEAFITLAAHDLRSPIRNVKGLTSMLLDDFEDLGDGKVQVLGKLDSVADQAMSLISDVLNHAEATGATESVEQFALEPLCQDILAMLDPAGKHVARVDNRIVHADKTAVQIVLRNLLDNAIKHNVNRSLCLGVSVAKHYDGFVRISVCDDGVGLDESTLMFLNGAELRMGNGYGLLGIRNLLRTRGGSISAENAENADAEPSGAVVRFVLPGSLC